MKAVPRDDVYDGLRLRTVNLCYDLAMSTMVTELAEVRATPTQFHE